MHVPDGFLSAGVAAGTWVVSASTLGWALKAETKDPQRIPAGTLASKEYVLGTDILWYPENVVGDVPTS